MVCNLRTTNAANNQHYQAQPDKINLKINKKSKIRDYLKGIASYYGKADGFDGKPMANGKNFQANNPNIAAHPTLPLGTKLKVTDLRSHKSIFVEITDRMPKNMGRVIDLSYSGAKALGIHKHGIGPVKLTIITNREFKKKTLPLN